MAPRTELAVLLRELAPRLDSERWVFVTAHDDPVLEREALMRFREAEGTTLVLPVAVAQAQGFAAETTVFRRIVLSVHSALDAVGLTAAVSGALADAGIPANVVAAWHHDHLFVPDQRAEAALAVLEALSRSARA